MGSLHSSPFFSPAHDSRTNPEHPLKFVPLVFEVLGPDTFDIVICLAKSSSSSELITISSHAFSCSYAGIHSLCSCSLFSLFARHFTLNSLFMQKELCKLRLTFFAKSSSYINSLALVLSRDTLPVVIALRWVIKGLLKASGPISARNCRYSF